MKKSIVLFKIIVSFVVSLIISFSLGFLAEMYGWPWISGYLLGLLMGFVVFSLLNLIDIGIRNKR